MAEFCKQCANELGFPESDFIDPNLKPGYYNTNLCEGCGFIQTNAKGECISFDCSKQGHNEIKNYLVDNDDIKLYGLGLDIIEEGITIPKEDLGNYIIIDQIHSALINDNAKFFICEEGNTYSVFKKITKPLYQLDPNTKPYTRMFFTGEQTLQLSDLENTNLLLGSTNRYGDVEVLDTMHNLKCLINPKHLKKVN